MMATAQRASTQPTSPPPSSSSTTTSSSSSSASPSQNPPRGAFIVLEGGDRSGKSSQVARLVASLRAAGIPARALSFPQRATPTGQLLHAHLTSSPSKMDVDSKNEASGDGERGALPGGGTGTGTRTGTGTGTEPPYKRATPSLVPPSPHMLHLLFSANRWEALPGMIAALTGDEGDDAWDLPSDSPPETETKGESRERGGGTTLVVDRYAYSGIAYTLASNHAYIHAQQQQQRQKAEKMSSTGSSKPTAVLDLDWCKGPDRGLLQPDLTLFLDLDPQLAAQRGAFGNEVYERLDVQTRVRRVFKECLIEPDTTWRVLDASKDREALAAEILDLAKNVIERVKHQPLSFDLFKK